MKSGYLTGQLDTARPADLLIRRTMDSFSYLSVIPSIVLGLAIAQVLSGFRGLNID
jgi:hypothetical protein